MQRLDFNTGWHFSCPDGRDFDVTLPHDAMLNTPRNTEPGFTWFLLAGWRGNDYTYTKNLHITSELINKHLVLEFEGVYCMTTVTVNDRPAAEKPIRLLYPVPRLQKERALRDTHFSRQAASAKWGIRTILSTRPS